ncbi:hypothetical protein [Shewanella sp. UCD-KL12]|uniref:hypothetical protein n=1 Tax=Shewanella sp. UCD-KL12 TaxID=1917163 RepID=UPI0009704DDD|nr:hypothetical protein [Shewanella sp. UCD-KL12]
MKNIIKASLLCVVCSSVFAAQHSNEEQIESDLSVIQKFQVKKLNELYRVDGENTPNEDVIISPMGNCSPWPLCGQLEK